MVAESYAIRSAATTAQALLFACMDCKGIGPVHDVSAAQWSFLLRHSALTGLADLKGHKVALAAAVLTDIVYVAVPAYLQYSNEPCPTRVEEPL